MKIRIALAAASLLFAAGCPPPDPPPPPPPDDNTGECAIEANAPLQRGLGSSDALELDTPVQGTLCPQRDNDGFRINVAAPSSVLVVTLSMETNITPITPVVDIFFDDGSDAPPAIGTGEDPLSSSAGHIINFTSFHRVELAGEYVLVVRDKDGFDANFDNVNLYTLTVAVQPDPDANEPNNIPEEAAPISAGTVNGIIATQGDDDWYAIEAPGNAQIIDIVITAPEDSGIEHVATLLLNDALTILQNEELLPGDVEGEVTAHIRQRVTGVAGTPFLLRIEDGGDDGDQDSNIDAALAQYTMVVTIIADPDVNEGANGNDTVDTATAVSNGNTITAALASFNDQDVYRIASNPNPGVLVVTIDFAGTLDAEFQPQVRILTGDPEAGSIPACANGCEVCYDGKCGEARMQRFITQSGFRIGYPVRNNEPLFIAVNEFNDDAFQDGDNYTINFDIQPEPEGGNEGDDFLIPNLEEAGYANGGQLDNQREESKQRARSRPSGLPPVCPTATPTGTGCLDVTTVAAPNPFLPNDTVNCSDPEAAPVTVTMNGRLSFEGDRDYFVIPDFPDLGYYALEIDYSIDRASPVELAIFVHGDNGDALAGSTLEGAQETGRCREQDGGQNACNADSICVDERCWSDGPSNPAVPSRTFGDDECVLAFDNVSRPLFIEVVDNGINDFDLDMNYSLSVTLICGCPASCDNDSDFCQDG